MSIDVAFLPSAGKGTRMGAAGKVLPKPLWPLFETTLLGLQIKYLKTLGVKKFYINAHHQAKLLKEYCESHFSEVIVLEEENLLGSGGALHNLKKNAKDLGRVIISNSDLIYLLSKDQWKHVMKLTDKGQNCLIGLHCEKGANYNELKVTKENEFVGVEKPPGDRDYLTYSGVGILNLDTFDFQSGESSFFETVVNPKINETKITSFSKGEYWDFGTLDLYIKSSLDILKDNSSELYAFLEREEILKKDKEYLKNGILKFRDITIEINPDSYKDSVVNLSRCTE